MVTKKQEKLEILRRYKEKTGKTEVDMKEVAQYGLTLGLSLPKPKDPLDRLAEEFTKAARDEIRYDQKTGKPYRANHAISASQGNQQYHLWIDIDEAPRKLMHKSLIMRREQMVGDGLQLTLDAMHWNSVNQSEEPIEIPLDFTDDVEWKLNSPDDDKKVA
jgi:hypothetical protein